METIRQIIDDALDGKLHYGSYSVKMMELGVEIIALDCLRSIHTCYMNDGRVFEYPVDEKHNFPVAKIFSQVGVVAALEKYDSESITAREFLKALCDAGVAYARCAYAANKAMYVGLNQDVHLEQW